MEFELTPPEVDLYQPLVTPLLASLSAHLPCPQNTASLSGTVVVYPGNVQAQNGLLQVPTSGSGASLRPECTFDTVGTLYMEREVLSVCMESAVRTRHSVPPDFGQLLYVYTPMTNLAAVASVYGGYEYATMDGCPENPGTSCV